MFGLVRSTPQQLRALAFLVAGLIPLSPAGLPARAEQPAVETISLLMDQAKLVKLPGGADTIVIGNPAIADVTVQKNGVLVLTGRSAGRTNFIALNASGNIISESMVTVTVPSAGRVLVQRGLEPSSYDCAPLCLPTVALGDEEKHFNRSVDQAQRRDGMANQSATAPGAKK
ncbi:MAG: pilus assembly protein N-terminal domain-containing protein [Beijerinckiaceae bacterium]|jgi:Flp pilus assembly secretin CpaC|nr:pilus assembly protein N-terminal domain-containing protein [Beijerinckiaceae bacterium]